MDQRKRSQLKKSRAQGKRNATAQHVHADRRLVYAAAFLVLVVLSVPVVVLWEKANRRRLLEEGPAQAEAAAEPVVQRRFDTLHALLQAEPEALAEADIAEVNLLCATALPGSDTLDIDACLAKLDRWAHRVASETERHLHRMNDPKTSRRFDRSSNRFRAAMLLQVLQEDFKVQYMSWPHKVTEADVKANRYLISLSPRKELACFMAARGHCLADTGATRGAAAAYAHAHRLAPKDPSYHAWLLQAQARLNGHHPSASGATPHGMAEGPMVYDMNPQREIDRINAYNRHLMRGRRRPTRPNHPSVPNPQAEGTPR